MVNNEVLFFRLIFLYDSFYSTYKSATPQYFHKLMKPGTKKSYGFRFEITKKKPSLKVGTAFNDCLPYENLYQLINSRKQARQCQVHIS